MAKTGAVEEIEVTATGTRHRALCVVYGLPETSGWDMISILRKI